MSDSLARRESNACTTLNLRLPLDLTTSFTSPLLTIIVGPTPSTQTFHAHRNILTTNSAFFAAASRNNWRETQDRTINLPEQTPESFQIFLTFVYTGTVCCTSPSDENESSDGEYDRLRDCWILGATLLCPAFQDAVIDALIQKIVAENAYPTTMHRSVYAQTSTPNGLSRLMVDLTVWSFDDEDWEILMQSKETPGEFWRDIAVRERDLLENEWEMGRGTRPWLTPGCRYHEHAVGEACWRTTFRVE